MRIFNTHFATLAVLNRHYSECKIYLVLELAGVSAADGDHAPVHVELSDDGRAPFQLWAEGLRRTATQAQQADQDVLLGILVGEEGLPAAVGHIVPPDQLHLKYDCVEWM